MYASTVTPWRGPLQRAAARSCGVAVVLLGLFLPAAADQRHLPPVVLGPLGEREVLLINRAPNAVVELYASPSNADDWGGERLGDNGLDVGRSLRLRLGRTRVCSFDVAVVYDNLWREEKRDTDICSIRQLVFDGTKAVQPPEPPGQPHILTLVNGGRLVVQQVFISAPNAPQWGDDLVADRGLSVGESRIITYVGGCLADVRVVFGNRAAEERRAIDLCAPVPLRIVPGWTTAPREGEPD